jgi:nucleotide-binding universal stress UspA family protein
MDPLEQGGAMTVVVGYVPTETGFSAVTEAERQARWRDVPVVIVNVVGTAGYVVPTAADQHDLDAVTAHLTSNGVRNSLRQITDDASPADIILGVAREVDASLIVLGLHQRSWLAKRVLGSTARSVVLAAPCAVLVVPDIDQHNKEPRSANVDAPPLRSMGQTPPWTPRKPDDDASRS